MISDSDKFFLSREICTVLGMIIKNFFIVGEIIYICSTIELDIVCDVIEIFFLDSVEVFESVFSLSCICLRREILLFKFIDFSFLVIESNRTKL